VPSGAGQVRFKLTCNVQGQTGHEGNNEANPNLFRFQFSLRTDKDGLGWYLQGYKGAGLVCLGYYGTAAIDER
jgi:hypothetical protein